MNMTDLRPKFRNFFPKFLQLVSKPGAISLPKALKTEAVSEVLKWLLIHIKSNWPLVAIVMVSVIFFSPAFFNNKIPLPADALVATHVPWTEISWKEYPAGIPVKNNEITDSISQFYPWRSVVGEFWRAGKFPLWNSYMFSGAPFLATWHAAGLYPLNTLYLFFDDMDAWTLLVFFQVLLSGIFMYLFLRTLSVHAYASYLGAIAFAFSGYMISWLEFATGGHAGLWLPLLLLLEIKLSQSTKPIFIVPISIIFFFIYTGGDFQVPFYITVTYLLLAAYLYLQKEIKSPFGFRVFLGLVGGVLLSAPQLLPTFKLYFDSIRTVDPLIEEIEYGFLPWKNIATLLWPDFFGNVVTGNYWGKWNIHEYTFFVGSVTGVFLLSSLLSKKEKYEKFFWILLILCFLFLFPTPIAFLPYKLQIPGLSTSPASRLLFLVDFCICVVASFSFSKWLAMKNDFPLKIAALLLLVSVVMAGIIVTIVLYLTKNSVIQSELARNLTVSLRNMVPTTVVLIFFGAIMSLKHLAGHFTKFGIGKKEVLKIILFSTCFLATAELLRFSWKNTTFAPREFVYPETKLTQFLKEKKDPFRIAGGIPLNLFMMLRLPSVEGYDPLYPKRMSEWFSLVNNKNFDAPSHRFAKIHDFSSTLLDYANVKYVIDYKKDRFGGVSEEGKYSAGIFPPKYSEVFQEGRIKVFENTTYLPYVWLGTKYLVEKNAEAYITNLLDGGGRDEKLILLEENPNIAITPHDIKFSVHNLKKGYNSIYFEAEASENALVFLSESYDTSWKAYVDGWEVRVMRANYIFQSIVLPKGKHTVAFIYSPKSFRIGIVLSVTTLVLLLFIAFQKNKKG